MRSRVSLPIFIGIAIAVVLIAISSVLGVLAVDQPPEVVHMEAEVYNLPADFTATSVKVWAVDPDDEFETLKFVWDAETGTIIDDTGTPNEIQYKPPPVPGIYWVTVTVRDSWGKTDTAKIPIRVLESTDR